MHKNPWLQPGAIGAGALAGLLVFITAAGGEVRPASQVPFDLAVQEMNVKQISSRPMFRTVEITCVVENRGPKTSSATAWLLISRPNDASPLVLREFSLPKHMEPGEKVQVRSQAFSWVASSVPYRCEIEFGGADLAGDADRSNDFAEFSFPKI